MSFQVYFIIENPFSNCVKVGKSTDIAGRVKQLQTGNSAQLSLRHLINCVDATVMNNLEIKIHQDLKDQKKHVRGEWFNLSLDEIDIIYQKYNNNVATNVCDNNKIIHNNNMDDIYKIIDNITNTINGITLTSADVPTINIINHIDNINNINNHNQINKYANPPDDLKCYHCGKLFNTIQASRRHHERKTPCVIRNVLPHDLHNPLRCIYCNKIFANNSNLQKHHKTCVIKNGGTDLLADHARMTQQIDHIQKSNQAIGWEIKKLKNQIKHLEQNR